MRSAVVIMQSVSGAARALLLLGVLALAGCTHTAPKLASGDIQWTEPTKRVVVLDPDVALSELTIGGMSEPRADWTSEAKTYVGESLHRILVARGVDVVDAGSLDDPRAVQLIKLNDAVGLAIRMHLYISPLKLPNKANALDWTLGPGANMLRDKYGADYALFTNIRDSYSSGSRKVLMLLAAAGGVAVPGGQQYGIASLIDLRTGNIVWFNQMDSATGDLRSETPASKAMHSLLDGLPL